MPRSFFTLALSLILCSAAHAGHGESKIRHAIETHTWTETRDALLLSDALPTEETEALLDHDDWRMALAAHALESWRSDAEHAGEVWKAEPLETRTGAPRFALEVGPHLPILERLVLGQDTTETRVALVDAAIRSQGPWIPWIAEVAQSDPTPEVRRIAAESLRHGDIDEVRSALMVTLQDPEPGVRAASVRAIGRLAPDTTLHAALLNATTDVDDEVAGYAARSLGWHQSATAYDAIAQLLLRSSETTRVHALRALDRINSPRTAIDPRVKDRCTDSSQQVKNIVQMLTEC